MLGKLRNPPVDILHMPTLHHGVYYSGEVPDWIARKAKPARVRMFAASDLTELRERQDRMITRQADNLPFEALEINSSPVVIENARFAQGLVQISDRFWLNGASGGRVRTKFERRNPEDWRLQRYHTAFVRSRNNGEGRIGKYTGNDANELEIAIELKNGHNYYHYSTETLGSLAHFVDDDSDKQITLHVGNGEMKGFVRKFIDAIYPSLSHRVSFQQKPTRYDRVRSVYSHQHYLYAAADPKLDEALSDPDLDTRWFDLARGPRQVKTVAIQSYDMSLRLLREQALAQVEAANITSAPRYIWLGRDEGNDARNRGLTGQEPLLEELAAKGFEQVVFEHLTPLEQIAAMNSADIVIAPHGAGLANMIYAKPGALVIEIGTRQTQLHRWGDFVKCAHVSQCHYDTVFADIAGHETTGEVPPMAQGHCGVHVGKMATDQIIASIDAHVSSTETADK